MGSPGVDAVLTEGYGGSIQGRCALTIGVPYVETVDTNGGDSRSHACARTKDVMDDENQTHRKKSSAFLKVGMVMLGVLVLLGVIQAVTAGTIGVGALSVSLRETRSTVPTTSPAPAATSSSGDSAGLDGAVGSDPSSSASSDPSSSAEAGAQPSAETKVADGSWKQARGLLTVEVTKVENEGGRLKVFVTAINASTSKMDLPVASISAVDDAERNYAASLSTSRWPASIAKNSAINGFVVLDQKASASGTTFSLTFAGIIGQLAPTGGAVTVTGVPIPK